MPLVYPIPSEKCEKIQRYKVKSFRKKSYTLNKLIAYWTTYKSYNNETGISRISSSSKAGPARSGTYVLVNVRRNGDGEFSGMSHLNSFMYSHCLETSSAPQSSRRDFTRRIPNCPPRLRDHGDGRRTRAPACLPIDESNCAWMNRLDSSRLNEIDERIFVVGISPIDT